MSALMTRTNTMTKENLPIPTHQFFHINISLNGLLKPGLPGNKVEICLLHYIKSSQVIHSAILVRMK